MARYKLTPKRRRSILKAQVISARKRKNVRAKDTIGYWMAKGVRKGANLASGGTAGMISDFMDENGRAAQKARARKRRRR